MSNQIDTYRTISKVSEGFYKEKGSKFYGFAIPCNHKDEAKTEIDRLRKEHHNAVHVCFAWRFGCAEPFEDRYSDDGEPNNSAGKPIFGQIISAEITNTLIAVVRYYGGTNLGVGGLINAYRTSAKEAIINGEIRQCYVMNYHTLSYDYGLTGDIMNLLNKAGAIIEKQGFADNLPNIDFKIRQSASESLLKEFEQFSSISIKYLKTI